MRTIIKIILLSLLIPILWACGEEEEVNVLPSEPVYFEFNLRIDNVLLTSGNYKEYVKGSYPTLVGQYLGYGGLLVVRSLIDEEIPFKAYDLSCPYEKMANVRVKASSDKGIVATCEKCGRVYDLLNDGRISSESSTLHLQRYRVNLTSDPNVFRVTRK